MIQRTNSMYCYPVAIKSFTRFLILLLYKPELLISYCWDIFFISNIDFKAQHTAWKVTFLNYFSFLLVMELSYWLLNLREEIKDELCTALSYESSHLSSQIRLLYQSIDLYRHLYQSIDL